jgi:hypothetical protein
MAEASFQMANGWIALPITADCGPKHPLALVAGKLRYDACLHADTLVEAPLVAALAQLVEHIIRNDGVTGSSPVSGTIDPIIQ